MISTLLPLLFCAATPPAATLLEYEGEIFAERDEDIRKEIGLTVLVVDAKEESTTIAWALREKGQGSWPWVEQLGKLEIDRRGKLLAGKSPSLLFEHADGVSPVPLVPAVFRGPKEFAEGASWRANRLQFEVRRPKDQQIAKSKWQIDVSTPIGRKRTLLVDQDDGIVTDVEEIVFVGPGKKHALRLVLVSEKQLDADIHARTVDAFSALFELREELNYELQGGRVQWNDRQQATMNEQLPTIVKQAQGTPLESLALRAGSEVRLQYAVAAATAKLKEQFVGRAAPRLELPSASLSGPALSTKNPSGKPMVLHFWDYRDNPLVEPYGQIGYLDFLYRRHKADGVVVFGVVTDERLDRPDARSDAIRSTRKLQKFMNVGYPVVLGGREILEKFGDPTRMGAELPLVVVIDGEGKITHYHLGLYDVDNRDGLVELNLAVEKAK